MVNTCHNGFACVRGAYCGGADTILEAVPTSVTGVEGTCVSTAVVGLIWNSTRASGPQQLKALVNPFSLEKRKLPDESIAIVLLARL